MTTETILLEPELEIEALEAAIEGVEEWPDDVPMRTRWYSHKLNIDMFSHDREVAPSSEFG